MRQMNNGGLFAMRLALSFSEHGILPSLLPRLSLAQIPFHLCFRDSMCHPSVPAKGFQALESAFNAAPVSPHNTEPTKSTCNFKSHDATSQRTFLRATLLPRLLVHRAFDCDNDSIAVQLQRFRHLSFEDFAQVHESLSLSLASRLIKLEPVG